MTQSPSGSRAPGGVLTDPDFIVRHLIAALEADGYLDVRLDDGTDVHACLLLDETRDQEINRWRAMRESGQLLISPLEPAVTSAQLAACASISLAFLDHVTGLEARVVYLGEGSYRGLAAHRVSFPDQLIKHKNRHARRARVLAPLTVHANLRLTDGRLVVAPVWDLNNLGLSLIWSDSFMPALGQTLALDLLMANLAPVAVTGEVRFVQEVSPTGWRVGLRFAGLAPAEDTPEPLQQLVIRVAEHYQLHLRRRFQAYLAA